MRWLRALSAIKQLAVFLAIFAAFQAKADMAYVTNQNSNDLSVLDLIARAEVLRIPVPGGPAGVQVAPDLGSVFTVSPNDKTLRRFDLQTGAAQGVLQLDGGPVGIARFENRLFVSDWYNARIWAIDAISLDITAELPTGAAPAGLVVSPLGEWLVSADRDANALSVFNLETLELNRKIIVGEHPFAVTFGPQGRVYSADVLSNTVTVVDPKTGAIIGSLQTGDRPYGVAFTQDKIFVSNQYSDTVSVFDLISLNPIAAIDVGEYPEGIASFDNGQRIVVANWFSNTVSVIDAQNLELLYEIETGDGPRAFGQFIVDRRQIE